MTHRIGSALIWAVLVLLVVLPLTSCSHASTVEPAAKSPAAVSVTPSPATAGPDPAVAAAVGFEQAHCSWDWRQPMSTYIAAQQELATGAYGQHLQAEADSVSWKQEVVAGRQQVSCTISTPGRLDGAPSTPSRIYVRMSVLEHITSTMGSFDGGTTIASWLVERVGGRWLVAGTFSGG